MQPQPNPLTHGRVRRKEETQREKGRPSSKHALATSTVDRVTKMASSFLIPALVLFTSLAAAEDARIRSEDTIPDWVSDVALGMTLSTVGGDDYPYQYFVVPLTSAAEDSQADDQNVCFHVQRRVVPQQGQTRARSGDMLLTLDVASVPPHRLLPTPICTPETNR